MTQYGKRIIFDKLNGNVLNYCLEEMAGALQEGLRPTEIDFIDLPYGDTTLQEVNQYHIDVATKTIIIDSKLQHIQTDSERIVELENILLESEGLI